jgi:hypothetical protein
MFKNISDDIVAKIMAYGNIKDLNAYSSINKYNKMVYHMNKHRILKDLIDKRCNFVETSSSYNFQMGNKTVSITKTLKSTLIQAMYLSELF